MEFGKTRKSEIIKMVADKTGQHKNVVGQVFYKIMDVIYDELKQGNEVNLPYLGTFHFVDKKEMISNLTKQVIPPHKLVRFRVNQGLAVFIRKKSRV